MGAKIKANELGAMILQSNEFRTLQHAKQIIDNNNEYKVKIKQLREKQVELQKSLIQSKQPDSTKMNSVKNYYDELSKNADFKRFFDAEKKFDEFVADILKIISDRIDGAFR